MNGGHDYQCQVTQLCERAARLADHLASRHMLAEAEIVLGLRQAVRVMWSEANPEPVPEPAPEPAPAPSPEPAPPPDPPPDLKLVG